MRSSSATKNIGPRQSRSSTRGKGGAGKGGGGSRGRSSCFPFGELVELQDSHHVPIDELRPGEVVRHGGQVLAVMKLLPATNDIIFRYNESVWVTGDHKVWENGALLPKNANNTLFADWEEEYYDDYVCEPGSDFWLDKLNGNQAGSTCQFFDDDDEEDDDDDPMEEGAFAAGTLIARPNGMPPTAIEDLLPGDVVLGGRVTGVVQLQMPIGEPIYRYPSPTNARDEAIIATAWTIVHDSEINAWDYIQKDTKAKAMEGLQKEEVFYQLMTTSHRITTASEHMTFADYEVLNDNEIDQAIMVMRSESALQLA